MKRALLLLLSALTLLFANPAPAQEWVLTVGQPVDNRLKYYAVAWSEPEQGWVAGAWHKSGEGSLVVSFSADGQTSQPWKWSSGDLVESASGFAFTEQGMIVLTEAPTRPGAYLAQAGGGSLTRLWSAEQWDMYLFDGEGVACIGSNLSKQGGKLSWLDGTVFTPPMYDETGWGLFAWDALYFNNTWVAGTAKAKHYNSPDGGRLAALRDSGWEITPYRGAGVIDVFTVGAGLGFTTATGHEFYTEDLINFKESFHGDEGHNLWRVESSGQVLHYSGAGSFWWGGGYTKIADADFMFLADNGKGELGGVVEIEGITYWVRASQK